MIGERHAKRPKVGDTIENGRYGLVTVTKVHGSGRVLDVQTRVHGIQRIERHRDGWWLVKEPVAWAAWNQGFFPSVRQAAKAALEWHSHPDRPANYGRSQLFIIRHDTRKGWRLVNCGSRGPSYGDAAGGFYGPITAANAASVWKEHQ